MAVDVSGLVNMLATQPGQQMASLGKQLMDAKQEADKQRQLQFENTRKTAKDALEAKLANQELQLNDIKLLNEKADAVLPVFNSLLITQDPMKRQQLYREAIPTLQKVGTPPEIIQEIGQNLGSNDYLAGQVAKGLSAKDIFTITRGSSIEPTAAAKKKAELKAAGVPDEQAEGIAYGTYKVITDDTGTQRVFDLRSGGRLSPEQEATVLEHTSTQQLEKKYEPRIVVKGTKPERERAKAVQNLAEDMKKTGAPKLEAALETVESIIGNTYGKGKNLPGYGGLEAGLPDWAVGIYSEEGQDLRQALVKLFNIELAERSGAAVTNQELERLRDEFKQGLLKSERQLVEGVNLFRKRVEDDKQAALAGYPDDVKQQYWEQGGVTLREMKEKPKESPKGPTEEQIRADAKKYKWTEEQTQEAINKYVRK